MLPPLSQIGNLGRGSVSRNEAMRAYENDPELRAEFARLQRAFLESASRDVGEVLRIIDSSGSEVLGGEPGMRLRTIAHGLRGAGGSYGFDAVTSIAGELEEAFLAKRSASALREAAVLLAGAIEAARKSMEANCVWR